MSVGSFEELSDVELRRKLLEYGFPNVPVTETSRNILVKKLKNHVKNMKNRKRCQKAITDMSQSSQLRAQQELTNLITQQANQGETVEVDEAAGLCSLHENMNFNSRIEVVSSRSSIATTSEHLQSAEQLHLAQVALAQRRRVRQQLVQRADAATAEEESIGFVALIFKILGLHENFTNIVWWCFTIFFGVIIFMYLSNITDLSKIIHERNTHYIQCGRSDPAALLTRPPYVCIDRERLQPALAVVRELLRLLHTRAERHFCHDRHYPRAVSVSEFMRHFYEGGSAVDLRNIESAQYLITCNPQWRIEMVDAIGTPVIFNGVDKLLPNHKTYFVLLRPHLPLFCTLYNKFQRFLGIISQFALLLFIALIAFLIYCYVRRKQDQHLHFVENYLIAIVGELRRRAAINDNADDRLVLINHLRDELIPLAKRCNALSSWNEALRVLEENDSRIRFGVVTRNGEEFRTMEWIENKELMNGNTSEHIETTC